MFGRDFSTLSGSWDPWRDFERLQSDLTRLLSETRDASPADYPRVNVWTHEAGALVSALIPGVEPDSLDISVLGETVTIRGKVKEEQVSGATTYHRRERPNGTFSRTVSVPFRIDAETVKAKYTHGLLAVELPRSQEEKPKRIAISAK